MNFRMRREMIFRTRVVLRREVKFSLSADQFYEINIGPRVAEFPSRVNL